MTISRTADRLEVCEPGGRPVDLAEAQQLIRDAALHDRPVGPVGLELEGHVVDRRHPERAVVDAAVQRVVADLPTLPHGGRLSVEPGGQLEISTCCLPGVSSAVDALQADSAVLRARLRAEGLGWLLLGTDPLRTPRLANPTLRYRAMDAWFLAHDHGRSGHTMMRSTAALQVNLEAGPPGQWADRVRRAGRLAPVLTALTGSSAFLAGVDTAAASARQLAWSGLDPLTAGPLPDTDAPVQAWVDRALAAPVMLVDRDGDLGPADRRRSLRDWIADPQGWPPATAADLRRHLTTLFPPVRLRGWLELRYCDSLPGSWWPAVVTAVVGWLDDPASAAEVDAALGQSAVGLSEAARVGLTDPRLRATAVTLLELARAVPSPQQEAIGALLDLARCGQTPGSLIATQMRRRGPHAVAKELADD